MADMDVFAAMGISGFGKTVQKKELDPSRFDKNKRDEVGSFNSVYPSQRNKGPNHIFVRRTHQSLRESRLQALLPALLPFHRLKAVKVTKGKTTTTTTKKNKVLRRLPKPTTRRAKTNQKSLNSNRQAEKRTTRIFPSSPSRMRLH